MTTHDVEPPRFLADAMLERLARWLRVLGADAVLDATQPDAALVRRADDEGRVLLTRDRHLLRELRPVRALEIRTDDPLMQLREVIDAHALAPPAELFTRCLLCNVPLSAPLPDADAATLVPVGVTGPVRTCPRCGRAYWLGSHARRMREALERALPGWMR